MRVTAQRGRNYGCYCTRRQRSPHQDSPLEPELQATLDIVPAQVWYASPSGALRFVNERAADYGGLPKDHPLRFGTDTGADYVKRAAGPGHELQDWLQAGRELKCD